MPHYSGDLKRDLNLENYPSIGAGRTCRKNLQSPLPSRGARYQLRQGLLGNKVSASQTCAEAKDQYPAQYYDGYYDLGYYSDAYYYGKARPRYFARGFGSQARPLHSGFCGSRLGAVVLGDSGFEESIKRPKQLPKLFYFIWGVPFCRYSIPKPYSSYHP